MNNKPVGLYLIGGAAGFLSGVLMLVSSYIVVTRLQAAALGTPGVEVVGSDARIERCKSHPDCANSDCVVCAAQQRRDGAQLPWNRFCDDVVSHRNGWASLSNCSASCLGRAARESPHQCDGDLPSVGRVHGSTATHRHILCLAHRSMLWSLAYWRLESTGRIYLLDRCSRVSNRDADS